MKVGFIDIVNIFQILLIYKDECINRSYPRLSMSEDMNGEMEVILNKFLILHTWRMKVNPLKWTKIECKIVKKHN